jgi:hypothetical protein
VITPYASDVQQEHLGSGAVHQVLEERRALFEYLMQFAPDPAEEMIRESHNLFVDTIG